MLKNILIIGFTLLICLSVFATNIHVEYTTIGIQTWVAPFGVTKAYITAWGGSGGGAYSTTDLTYGGGGGGGAFTQTLTNITPGATYKGFVGRAGNAPNRKLLTSQDTNFWLNGGSLITLAKAGDNGAVSTGGLGGSSAYCVSNGISGVCTSGGNGGAGSYAFSTYWGGSGGGSGGLGGNGGNGSNTGSYGLAGAGSTSVGYGNYGGAIGGIGGDAYNGGSSIADPAHYAPGGGNGGGARYSATYAGTTTSIGSNGALYIDYNSTCDYSGSGNWLINCNENCKINTPTNIGNNSIVVYGTGAIDFNTTIHAGSYSFTGTSTTQRCTVTIRNGGLI